MLGLGLPIRINKRSGGGAPVPPPSYDADAVAYLTAIAVPNDSTVYYPSTAQEITGAEIWTAVNDFVLGLKAANLWTKSKAIYPFIGGTATAHKWNLKNPLDTNAAFRLQFFGGGTHSALGYLGNGSNAYANTFCTPSTDFANNANMGYYYMQRIVSGGGADMGCRNGSTNSWGLAAVRVDQSTIGQLDMTGLTSSFERLIPDAVGVGMYSVNYISAVEVYRAGSKLTTTNLQNRNFSRPSVPIYINAINRDNTAIDYVPKHCGFATLMEGLTSAEISTRDTLIQTLQTALKRHV